MCGVGGCMLRWVHMGRDPHLTFCHFSRDGDENRAVSSIIATFTYALSHASDFSVDARSLSSTNGRESKEAFAFHVLGLEQQKERGIAITISGFLGG